jgi:hypothetical protein
MYSDVGAWDWNVARRATYGGQKPVWSQFPIELGPDLIVSPHLYGWSEGPPPLARTRPGHRGRDTAYTICDVPDWLLYIARSRAHIEFLVTEVEPRLPEGCSLIVVDASRSVYLLPGARMEEPLALLPGFLNRRLGAEAIEPEAFAELNEPPPFLRPPVRSPDPRHVERVERHPLRLWEAFLLRGHGHRWELIGGEVPLAGIFHTALAANRALVGCATDAQRWTEQPATECAGWIEVGRFRLRQRGRRLDIRVALDPADVRVGFMPVSERAGSDELPTLAGVLVAGGDNGKTEWMEGYNWSTVICERPGETERLATRLAETVLRLGAPIVSERGPGDPFPTFEDGRWVISASSPYVTVYMPLYRDGCAPIHALHPEVIPEELGREGA